MNKISLNNREYPTKLKALADPPQTIFFEGDLIKLLDRPAVAIVGSRKASAYGQTVTERFARELASLGVVIVSGLAFGVDSISHKAALSVGGYTIAVLPSSLDSIYPRSHLNLAHQIAKQKGCLVTEYTPRSQIYNSNFIARNRIIAALSDAILITEAAAKSGSLHTANFGLDIGKEIFAVPGAITNVNSAGCNNLIKAGAKPATSPADVLDFLGLSAIENKEIVAANSDEYVIINLIKQGVSEADELQKQSGLKPTQFQQVMSMLEITGRITAVGGGKWAIN